MNGDSSPIIHKGACSVCRGPADELWFHSDWWHNEAVDCDGRNTGSFVASEVDP